MDNLLIYRAWDNSNKEMHNNFQFIRSGNESNDWIVFISDKQTLKENNPHPLKNPYFQKQFNIMRPVGINNLFEGDIVEFGTVGVIKYDEDRFYVDSGNIHTRVSKSHKKIGNIYENPDLINV